MIAIKIITGNSNFYARIGLLNKLMMHFTKKDIDSMNRVQRLNLINSITGVKPANLVGSRSKSGVSNLAIISSVVHLSSNPALIGFFTRPCGEYRRDTYNNIMDQQQYTINHILENDIKKAHYTSAKFDESISEFEACGFQEEYIDGIEAPFVKECEIKIGLQYQEHVKITSSNTTLIVGEIIHISLPSEILDQNGYMDLSTSKSVGISGLNSYYSLSLLDSFPYARVENIHKELM